jgi:hypothetical protein
MAREGLIWFDVDVFQDALDSAIGEMEKIVKLAIRSTMSRVRRYAVTHLSSELRAKWNLKKADLDKKIRVRVSNRGQSYEAFEMTIKGISISLSYFGAKQYAGNRVITRTVGRQNKRASKFQGVQVEVIKGRKTRLAGAFLQVADNGHIMVMKRKGKGRYPVAIKAAISPASMFNDAITADRFEEAMFSYIERTFEHELSWRLSQAGLI